MAAQVPVVSAPDVALQNVPDVRQQAPFHMMQMADAGPREMEQAGMQIDRAGEQTSQIATAQQININEGATKNNDANLMGGISTILNGGTDAQGNPTKGYLDMQGGDAISARDATVKALQDLPGKLASGMDNGAQQQMFQNIANMRVQAAINQVQQHFNQQTQVYHTAAATTRLQSATAMAQGSFDPTKDTPLPSSDPTAVNGNTPYQQAVRTAQSEANDLADLKGLTGTTPQDQAVRQQFIQQQMTQLYTGVIGHLIDNHDSQNATAYFNAVRGQLTPDMADRVQKTLETTNEQDFMLRYTDGMFAGGGTQSQQMDQVQQDFQDGKVSAGQRLLIENRISQHWNQQHEMENQSTASALGAAQDFAIKNPGKSVVDLPPNIYATLKNKGQLASADAFFSREDNKGNDALFNKLMGWAGDDPVGFVKQDLGTFQGQLSKSQMDRVQNAQRGINKQSVEQMQSDKMVNTVINTIGNDLTAAGLNTKPKAGSSDAQQLEQFKANLRMELYQHIDASKTPVRIQDALDLARKSLAVQTLSGTGVGGYFMSKKPIYQMTPQEQAAPWDISDADRTRITNVLKANGRQPSEALIQRYYKTEQGVKAQ